jgi:predicted 2-oxoglutarate/Fe(II)-dependent dioxygenase YbiX
MIEDHDDRAPGRSSIDDIIELYRTGLSWKDVGPGLLLEDFLDPPTCDAVLTDVRAAAGAAATVHGHGRTEAVIRVRHATQLAVCDATRRLVDGRLSDLTPALTERFGVALSAHEPLQFLRYETGGFFVAHQDGNTPLTRDRTRDRRISIVIFLNAQTPGSLGYTGGEFVFHAPYPDVDRRQAVVGAAGSLLAFRSETTHEVRMVTGGERYTIATWFHAATSTPRMPPTP